MTSFPRAIFVIVLLLRVEGRFLDANCTIQYSSDADQSISSCFGTWYSNYTSMQLSLFTIGARFNGIDASLTADITTPSRGALTLYNNYFPVAANIFFSTTGNGTASMVTTYWEHREEGDLLLVFDGYYSVRNLSFRVPQQTFGTYYLDWCVRFSSSTCNFDKVTNLHVLTFPPAQTWINCKVNIQKGIIGVDLWAFMHNRTMLEAFRIASKGDDGWLCAYSNGTSWLWGCGPEEGRTFEEVGFTNWAPNEPNVTVGAGCLYVDVVGLWYSKPCSTTYSCVAFRYSDLATAGRVRIDIRPPYNNLETQVEQTLFAKNTSNRSSTVFIPEATFRKGTVIAINTSGIDVLQIKGVYVSVISDDKATTLCTATNNHVCCEPITASDMQYVSNQRYIPNSGANLISSVLFVPCTGNANTRWNVSWYLDLTDRVYYRPYNLYLQSIKKDMNTCYSSVMEYRSRVAVADPQLHQFLQQNTSLEGWTCGHTFGNGTSWMWDCGFYGVEGSVITYPSNLSIPTTTKSQQCLYVKSGMFREGTCGIETPELQSATLCWTLPRNAIGKMTIVQVPTMQNASASSPTTSLNRNYVTFEDDESEKALVVATVVSSVGTVAAPSSASSLQIAVTFSMVTCQKNGIVVVDANNRNFALAPLHYMLGSSFGEALSAVLWNVIFMILVVGVQGSSVMMFRFRKSIPWNDAFSLARFPKMTMLVSRLLVVGTSFYTGRQLPQESSTIVVIVVLCDLCIIAIFLLSTARWHYLHHQTLCKYCDEELGRWDREDRYVAPPWLATRRSARYVLLPRGHWLRVTEAERNMYDVLFDDWLPNSFWWPLVSTGVVSAVAMLVGSASKTLDESICTTQLIVAGLLEIVLGILTLITSPFRVRVSCWTQTFALLTSGSIGVLKALQVAGGVSLICVVLLNIFAVADSVATAYVVWWYFRYFDGLKTHRKQRIGDDDPTPMTEMDVADVMESTVPEEDSQNPQQELEKEFLPRRNRRDATFQTKGGPLRASSPSAPPPPQNILTRDDVEL
eukprot:PhF_6_TR9996/c0_g2_i1/m.15203